MLSTVPKWRIVAKLHEPFKATKPFLCPWCGDCVSLPHEYKRAIPGDRHKYDPLGPTLVTRTYDVEWPDGTKMAHFCLAQGWHGRHKYEDGTKVSRTI